MIAKLTTDAYPYAVGGSIKGYKGQVKFMETVISGNYF